ncbi:hypothetical protein KTT_40950 [Tengunoibacter tsumagoiensis]|uniref:Uncharacterized protein n=2 Tax=Tengunoibacter tsumagoiensis TaxID=2014871 RepID=A0A402A5A8_9CHLR|nr:hypothetical protein KTT_40410 [Tengunoibacter tsumagoiensis]GCE14236.1 hypothetical protein KTT_40950 [Tengunoibacter tsumagoiensis]
MMISFYGLAACATLVLAHATVRRIFGEALAALIIVGALWTGLGIVATMIFWQLYNAVVSMWSAPTINMWQAWLAYLLVTIGVFIVGPVFSAHDDEIAL